MEPEVKKEDGRYCISMEQVELASEKVRRNKGAGGVDGMTWKEFDEHRKELLYKLWNRMTSGSYFPQATREVEIEKSGGGVRKLGIPVLLDRIAQQVVVSILEPATEKEFLPNSYGYRAGIGAHDAISRCREMCYIYGWVIDLDIEGFFDNIDHELLIKAVERFTKEKWILMYVKRWLVTPTRKRDGSVQERTKGTPQGGVISPMLANMFLHFTLDKWMKLHHTNNEFERYADDVIIHCRSLKEAEYLLGQIKERMEQCCLTLHPEKTRIVRCQKWGSDSEYPNKSFDFLGYRFKPRKAKTKKGEIRGTFTPGISIKSMKKIRTYIRENKVFKNTSKMIMEIGDDMRDRIRGWINYYGKFRPSEMRKVFTPINCQVGKLYAKKYKCTYIKAVEKLKRIAQNHCYIFYHWFKGYTSF
jgi:RNA-directed DNA polymerase